MSISRSEICRKSDAQTRQVAKAVSLEEGVKLGEKLGMVLICYRKTIGYGGSFAAPQIGEGKAVFVTFVDEQLQIFISGNLQNFVNIYKVDILSFQYII